MNTKSLTRTLLIVLILTFFDLIVNRVILDANQWSNSVWVFISNLLTVLVMYAVASSHLEQKKKLVVGIFVIAFGIGCFNILIEAWIFHVTDGNQTLQRLLTGFIRFSLLSSLLAYLAIQSPKTKERLDFKTRSSFDLVFRIIACSLLYLLFYFIAGIILKATLPALNDYYTGRLPAMTTLIYTQIFRGFFFTCIAIFFLRTNQLVKQKKLLLLGAIFSVLGGIAPLIHSNELMPAVIRLGHGFEIGISNFIYGWVIGYILYQPVNEKEMQNTK